MVKVMFVCLGNICRSPMAEAVFRKMVSDAGLSGEISVDSCGTDGWHIGEPPHRGTRDMLTEHGINYDGIYGSALKKEHLDEVDYIIAMDEENLSRILAFKKANSHAEARLLSHYAQGRWTVVPDPWYTGNFTLAYDLISEGCDGLLEHIVKKHRFVTKS